MEILVQLVLSLMAAFIILLVLVQRGRGGGLAGALGGPGGSSAFGAKAGDTFTKITIWAVSIWIVTCVLASYWAGNRGDAFGAGGGAFAAGAGDALDGMGDAATGDDAPAAGAATTGETAEQDAAAADTVPADTAPADAAPADEATNSGTDETPAE